MTGRSWAQNLTTVFLISGLTLTATALPNHNGGGNGNGNANSTSIAEFKNYVKSVRQSHNRQEVMRATAYLSRYHYKEIADLFLERLQHEIKNNPDIVIVNNILGHLGAFATQEQVHQLDEIIENLENTVHELFPGNAQNELEIFTETLEAMRARSGSLPPIPAGQAMQRQLPVVHEQTPALGSKTPLQNILADSQATDAKIIRESVTDYITDRIRKQIAEKRTNKIIGREKEASKALDVFVRLQGANPILIGPAGAGKTKLVERIAQMIVQQEYPGHGSFTDILDHAEIIQVTPASLVLTPLESEDKQTARFFDAISRYQKTNKKILIVFIDEMHSLSRKQIEALKPFLDNSDKGIRLIGASTSKEFELAYKHNEPAKRRFEPIPMEEFSFKQITAMLKEGSALRVEAAYEVHFTDDAIEAIAKNGLLVNPDSGRTDGAVKFLNDVAIQKRHEVDQKKLEITQDFVFAQVQKKLGYPADPNDSHAFSTYMNSVRTQLKGIVLNQDRMVDDLANAWQNLAEDTSGRGVRVVGLLGPTGVGKSKLGRSFAQVALRNSNAFFEIDANNFKNESQLNALFGAPPAYIGSDKGSGTLMEFLDDPARGKFGGVILINEPERATPEFWEKMMEALDVGRATGSDGRVRLMNRHLIVLASNRGDKMILPDGIEKWSDSELNSYLSKLSSDKLRDMVTQKLSAKDKFSLPDPIVARVDIWSVGRPITRSTAVLVARQMADYMKAQALEKRKIHLEIDDAVLDQIVQSSYKMSMGARPVEKAVNQYIQAAVSQASVKWPKFASGSTLKISMSADPTKMQVSYNNETVLAELPKIEDHNPLKSNEFIERMSKLHAVLTKAMPGQDEAVNAIADSVIGHRGAPAGSIQHPLSIFVTGTTDQVKAMGRGITEGLLDNPDRLAVIPVGDVNSEGKLLEIFGHMGQDEMRTFEKTLMSMPEGGVIQLSGFSKMGGNNPEAKAQLMEKFTSLLETGSWTSPATNKTYSLAKFVFLFESSMGEDLFAGTGSDDMRITVWKQNKNLAQVREFLLKQGVPQNFLRHMTETILLKPLLATEIEAQCTLIMEKELKPYRDQGLQIEFDQSFIKQMARSFYSMDSGESSLQDVIDSRLKGLLATTVIKLGGADAAQGKKFVLSISDNMPTRPWVRRTFKRQIDLSLQVQDNGTSTHSKTLDLTGYAGTGMQVDLNQAVVTNYHEAGHAVANITKFTGEKLQYLTSRPGGRFLGYARSGYAKEGVAPNNPTDQIVIAKLAATYAGSLAQQMAGYDKDTGWRGDLSQMRSLLHRYLITSGMHPEFTGVQMSKDGEPILNDAISARYKEVSDTYFASAQKLAEQRLRENWNLVRAVVKVLLTEGSLTGEDFERLKKQYPASPGQWVSTSPDFVPGSAARVVRPIRVCKDLFN